MLPILPALILLLLQGPAGIERMALRGQLPGALEALHRHIGQASEQRPAEEAVLASLLSVGTSRDLSRALMQLFTLIEAPQPAPSQVPTLEERKAAPPSWPPSFARLADGYLKSQRSRDGPF